MFDKDEFFKTPDTRIEKVLTPEWGAKFPFFFVRNMQGDQLENFEAGTYVVDGKKVIYNRQNLRGRIFVRSICDEAGNLLFTEEDAPKFSQKNSAPVSRLFDAAQRLSGITKEDIAELEKNSASGPAAAI